MAVKFNRKELYMIDDCLLEWLKGNQRIIRVEEMKLRRKENQASERNALAEIECQEEQIKLIKEIRNKLKPEF